MEDYQRRLINEFCVLRNRIEALRDAFAKDDFKETVGNNQFNLMKQQLNAMEEYYNILDQRIADLDLTRAVPVYVSPSEDNIKEQGFDPKISRTDVMARAYTECLNEMYFKSQPSASYDGYIEKLRNGEINLEDKIYERHYLADEEYRYILDKYVDAYGMNYKWRNYVDTVIDYLNDGATCDKWIEDECDEDGNLVSPGHRGYDKLPSIAKIFTDIIKEEKEKGTNDDKLGETLLDAVKKRIEMCRDFYRFDREESDFRCSIALGASPTTNKNTVKEYWKEHGVDVDIKEHDLDHLWEIDHYGEGCYEDYED